MGCGPSVTSGSVDLLAPRGKLRAGAAALKVVLAGATGVGKSCLAQRWVTNSFDSVRHLTIGSAFLTKSLSVRIPADDGKEDGMDTSVKFHLWDTAGEERYRAVAKSFFRSAKGALLVFDLTSAKSLEEVTYWHSMLVQEAPTAVIMVVGTKCDLEEIREVSQESALAVAGSLSAAGYGETSARTGHGVVEIFNRLAQLLAQKEME